MPLPTTPTSSLPLPPSIVPLSSELRQAFPSASPFPVFCLPSFSRLNFSPGVSVCEGKGKEAPGLAAEGRLMAGRTPGLGTSFQSTLLLGPAGALSAQ